MVGVAGEGLRAGVVGSVVGADHQHHVGGLQETEAAGPAEPVAGPPAGGGHIAHLADAGLAELLGGNQEAAESEPWHHHLRKGEIPIGISQALSGASMAKHSRSGHFSKRWRQAGQVIPFGTSAD
jgi:hypothetical protein